MTSALQYEAIERLLNAVDRVGDELEKMNHRVGDELEKMNHLAADRTTQIEEIALQLGKMNKLAGDPTRVINLNGEVMTMVNGVPCTDDQLQRLWVNKEQELRTDGEHQRAVWAAIRSAAEFNERVDEDTREDES
jgi:hypothetical protein